MYPDKLFLVCTQECTEEINSEFNKALNKSRTLWYFDKSISSFSTLGASNIQRYPEIPVFHMYEFIDV